MVRAWIADVSPLYDEKRFSRYYDSLPYFRKEKADRLRTQNGKVQSVGAWVLWDKIRAEYDLPESSVFNLSHSGTWVLCAAETEHIDAEVGCDLERVGEFREKVARRFFCREEYDTIMRADPEERADLFYRYWVLKESFMKATRRGMSLPADSFLIRLGTPPELVRRPEEYRKNYYYMEYRLEGVPYKISVCTTDGEIDSLLHTELTL